MKMTFSLAVKQFFGYEDNKVLMADIKQLDEATRAWLRSALTEKGYEFEPQQLASA